MNNVSCNKHHLVADSPPCIPVQPTSLWWWECNRSWQHPSTKEASLLITKPWETSQGRFWSEGKSGLGNPGPQIQLGGTFGPPVFMTEKSSGIRTMFQAEPCKAISTQWPKTNRQDSKKWREAILSLSSIRLNKKWQCVLGSKRNKAKPPGITRQDTSSLKCVYCTSI